MGLIALRKQFSNYNHNSISKQTIGKAKYFSDTDTFWNSNENSTRVNNDM